MKKVLFLFVSLLIVGCTNTGTGYSNRNIVYDSIIATALYNNNYPVPSLGYVDGISKTKSKTTTNSVTTSTVNSNINSNSQFQSFPSSSIGSNHTVSNSSSRTVTKSTSTTRTKGASFGIGF